MNSACSSRHQRSLFERRRAQIGLFILVLDLVFSPLCFRGVTASPHYILGQSNPLTASGIASSKIQGAQARRIVSPRSDKENQPALDGGLLPEWLSIQEVLRVVMKAKNNFIGGQGAKNEATESNRKSRDGYPARKLIRFSNKAPSDTRHLGANSQQKNANDFLITGYAQDRPTARETATFGFSTHNDDDYRKEEPAEEQTSEPTAASKSANIDEDDFYGAEPETATETSGGTTHTAAGQDGIGNSSAKPESTTATDFPSSEGTSGETLEPLPEEGSGSGGSTGGPHITGTLPANGGTAQPSSELGVYEENMTETTLEPVAGAAGLSNPNPTPEPVSTSQSTAASKPAASSQGVWGAHPVKPTRSTTTSPVTTSQSLPESGTTSQPTTGVQGGWGGPTADPATSLPVSSSSAAPIESQEPASPTEQEESEPLDNEGGSIESTAFSEKQPPEESVEELEEEKEKEEELEEELSQEEKEIRRIGGFGVFLAIVAMVFTAHQMSENPDGIYASCCRLILTLVGCGFKMVLLPFRSAVGGNRGYGHLPSVNTMDYGYRDPYRPGASNGGSMELS